MTASLWEQVAERFTAPVGGSWMRKARPDQLPPPEPWQTCYWRGGRGGGKTWAGSNNLAELIRTHPTTDDGPSEWAVIAPTIADARDTCIEGPSGLLKALGLPLMYAGWNRSMGQLRLPDGQVVYAGGADDGALRVQGKNLAGAWCDEIGLWKRWRTAWDESIGYAVRKSPARIIATGTPKRGMPAMALVKRLLADPDVVKRRLRTMDNADNLHGPALARMQLMRGTALGRQELEGEVLDEAEGALWTRDPAKADRDQLGLIQNGVLPRPGILGRTVVALDPSDGKEGGDGAGFVVASVGLDGLYVLHSDELHVGPTAQVREARRLFDLHGADRIVVEKNHGGAYLIDLFRTLDPLLPVKTVDASVGKRTRAEPVAALYTRPGVTHIGTGHDLLEDQMTSFTGAPGEDSPDVLDALVWALTDLAMSGATADFDDDLAHRFTDPDDVDFMSMPL